MRRHITFRSSALFQRKNLFTLGWLDTYLSVDLWSGDKRLSDIAATDYRRLLETDAVRHGFHYPATLKLNGRALPAYFISHHMAHAASIYYPLGSAECGHPDS